MKTKFECSFCGLTSEGPAIVSKCEDGHFQAKDAKVEKVSNFYSSWRYPTVICVRYPDGSLVRYNNTDVIEKARETE